ncbi:MAG: hypothetical protein RIC35_19270 [Marinoscillum sp.]
MIWIIINIILLLSLAFSFQPEEGPKKLYWIGLGIKTMMCFAFGCTYVFYLQSGDTLTFHEKANELYQLSEQSFGSYLKELFTPHYPIYQAEWRNEFFCKILSLPYVATQGNYWLSSLYLMLFSYLCTWFLIRSIWRYYPSLLIPAFVAFMIFPSPIFWSSGILKDTLVNGAVFYLAGLCIRYHYQSKFTFSQITVAIGCILLIFYMKYYLIALVGTLMILLAWNKVVKVFIQSKAIQITLTILLLIICVSIASKTNRNINVEQLPVALYNNYQSIQDQSTHTETLQLDIEPTYKSILLNIPQSLIAGLFRPYVWEVGSVKVWFGLENLLILLLALANIVFIPRMKPDLLSWLTLGFIIVLAVALPIASPNFGSLIRYKAVFIPFLVFLLTIKPYQVIVLKEH